MKRPALHFAIIALAALLGACHPDPVHEDKVKAQGPEDPGIPTGPLHRAGQPCLTCHSGSGPASMNMSLAGTVYQDIKSRTPVEGVVVHAFDSQGHQAITATNCVGNFFIQKKAFNPVWPVWIQLEYKGQPMLRMASPIFRDGSCADCHHDPGGPSSAGHVYASGGLVKLPPASCK